MANDSSCSGPQLKGTFSFTNSLMGSASSVSLGENFDKKFIIPINDCTSFLDPGDGI